MKEIVYAPIPEFNQHTQFIRQQNPVDMGNYIHVGVDIVSANLDEAVVKALVTAEKFAAIEQNIAAGKLTTNSQIGAALKVASAELAVAERADVKPIAEMPIDILTK